MLPPPPASPRPNLEVADIFRGEAAAFWQSHAERLSPAQQRVFSDVQVCRTAALGGNVRQCNACDHREISYNSCRNRHCPKCQARARAQWLAQRQAELLPIPYFHIVFTLPAEIAALALQNQRRLYGMLFAAASETLQEVAAQRRQLGDAQLGILAVLHTWGQNLMHHPHLHCVVSGGGPSRDGARWIASQDYYLLPVKVLSRVFRHKYCHLLKRAFQRGELSLHGKLAPLAEPQAFRRFLDNVTGRPWVVYAKRPFREPACVLKYLARYTHRVAISNRRLVSYRAGQVTFRYKDYAGRGRQRTMTLQASEFIRRFLLHVLPNGFMRIRHYGFLANRYRREKLETCRRLLGCQAPGEPSDDMDSRATEPVEQSTEPAAETETAIGCPVCQLGRMQIIETLARLPCHCHELFTQPARAIPYQDSS